MIKKILGASAVAMLLPFMASASVNFDNIAPVVFDNGNGWESNVDSSAGDTIKAKLIVDVTGDDDLNAVSYDFIGDFIPKVCIQLSQEQSQSINDFPVEIDMVAPNTPGSWDVQFVAYGNNGPELDFNCTNAVDTQNINDRVIVNVSTSNTGGSTGGGAGTVGNSLLAQLQAQLAALATAVANITKPVTPAPSASGKCAALANKMSGAQYGTRNSANIVLQGYLLGESMQIPALAAGASFGFWGPETNSALMQYKAINACQ